MYLCIYELHCIVGEYPGVPLKTMKISPPYLSSCVIVSPRSRSCQPSVARSSLFKSVLAYLGLSSTVPRIELVTEVYALSLLYWTGAGQKGKWEEPIGRRGGRSHRGHVAPGRETVIGENIGTNVCVWFTKAPTYQIRFLKTLKVFWPWIFFIRKENYIHDFRNLCLPFWC